MKDLARMQNPNNDDKVIDACSIFGVMDTTGRRFSGESVIRAIGNMHDRGNGLGGGFAAYGLYPEYADLYAFHIMFLSDKGKQQTEELMEKCFKVSYSEEIPTRPIPAIVNPPLLWRYFVEIGGQKPEEQSDDDYVLDRVMEINTRLDDTFVFSSGKNMGVFKGVGFPEEIGQYFRLEEYESYLWTAHGRFPTNTPGWWGGAHPFNILDWAVVHNGEISSYGTNRRYLEQFGYQCTMQTDTEVVAYAVDLVIRRHGLPVKMFSDIVAPPFWNDIERRPQKEKALLEALRQVYGGLLLNGPFTVIISHQGEMIGLTDRIRLRPLTVGEKGSMIYLSSEEASIRLICPDLEKVWSPMGGEPVIARLDEPIQPPIALAAEEGI